jgi:hypothetical protein
MSLVINAPEIEGRLQKEAARRGVTAEAVAVAILTSQLDAEHPDAEQKAPFYATASAEEWVAAFNRRVDGHPVRQPLPEDAFSRASFYGGRP